MSSKTPGKTKAKPKSRKAVNRNDVRHDAAVSGAGRQLSLTSQALGRVLTFEYPADSVLSRFFQEHRELGHRERGFIAETIYAVVRRLRWLYRLAGPEATPWQLLLTWLARGEGWPMRQFEGLVSATETEWIGEIKARTLAEGTLAERADLPDWLAGRLLESYDEGVFLELAYSLNRPAPLDLRVNVLKAERDEVLARLIRDGIEAVPAALSPQGIRLQGKPALQKHPLFVDGSFEVQDEGSQILGFLLQPRRGEMVVDFCAGAGGKTLQLGALMRSTGRLYAFDVAEKRLARLRPRVARAGLSNVHPVWIDHEHDARLKRFAGKADRVLVDAPCSGLGTLRRNPDLKWRQAPDAIAEMAARQRDILDAAAKLVRPGGRLVYATCSLLKRENDDVVDAFLATHPEFTPLAAEQVLSAQGIALATGERLRLSPLAHDTDGFFAAVFERRG
ncbi:NOL1/NOP2/Sun family protein [Betaproteobacteria bacterium]|nr:NOL1/NOP2/Sun family protein [Betaproteobacteria bacterium]GHU32470.1 NOL1/NOP2/Sun family protein [Betaproteobacteria bacterium]